MTFLCTISGVQPQEPCLSKTGYIFERRLIEKHLEESPVCPATGEPLTPKDLINIKTDVVTKPRPVTASSIPGLLSLLQSEWDALALETHNMRSHVDEVRKQLSYSLYQHDAATRVIARLIKQRDSALQEVEALKQQLLLFRTNYDVNSLETEFDKDTMVRLQDLAKVLLSERKKRDLSGYLDAEAFSKFKCAGEFRLHSSTKPGVLCVALDKSKNAQSLEESFCFTGGNDGSVVYFDLFNQKTVHTLNGHMKPVNTVVTHPLDNIALSGSDDSTIRVWREFETEFKCTYVLKHHKTSIKNLAMHPSGEYLLSLSSDGVWGLCNIDSGKVIKMHRNVPKCNALKIHPDGLVCIGAATNGTLQVWDIRDSTLKDPITTSSSGVNGVGTANGVSSAWVDLDFNENGYYLVSVSEAGELVLWDLRKQSVINTFSCNVNPTKVKFDQSGLYMGVSSTKVEVLYMKEKSKFELVHTLEGHNANVTDLEFGPYSKFLLTTCLDKSLRLYN
uniref:Pre-mRNA-processing factor 19 n=1 Tax=Theileria annulata TaxID=5874 RepID=A0A3B0MSU3_THEAN